MKLAASNIAWKGDDDHTVYTRLVELGFSGVEIAPTRIVKENPYASEHRSTAIQFAKKLSNDWGLKICSMQSLLYGIDERIFGTEEERKFLTAYMFKAIEFAADIECPHLVFGCPKNRNIDDVSREQTGIDFFSNCAQHAESNGVVIGLEANPIVYGTNYLNTTSEVIQVVKEINSSSLRVNYDLGADILNAEIPRDLSEIIQFISHIHISEPMLNPTISRVEHTQMVSQLSQMNYSKWVSLEMKDAGIDALDNSLKILSAFKNENC